MSIQSLLPGVARASLACCALVVLAQTIPARAAGLTLTQAQQRALVLSRQLAGQDAAITASRELAVAARQLPDPMLKLGIDNLPVSGSERFTWSSDFMTMRRIGIEQELTGSSKRAVRAERFERMADKSAAEKLAIAAAVERDTALAWLDLYYATAMAGVVSEQAEQAKAAIAAAQAAYKGGRGSQADVFAARSAAALVRDRASEVERRRLNAQTILTRWVGPEAELAISGSPDITHLQHDPEALNVLVEHHPEVAVLRRQEEVARAEARVAQAERDPDWRVELAYQQRGRDFSNMMSFGLSIPLAWDRKNRQDREVAARLALADQARDEREEAQRMHEAETRAMVGEWRTGLERLERYRNEIVPLATDRAGALLAAYRGGKSTLSEVLAARAGELDTKLQALQLEADTARLWARLNFLYPAGVIPSQGNHKEHP
jgi:outer membrane protein TolC